MKLFRLDLPPERVHQLVAELQKVVSADLTHPALARPVAAGIVGVSAYLAEDFVAADSLDVVVREYGPAPASEAVRIATQLAGALDFAAVVSVVHGALHPRDVLVSPEDTRLTGMGIAQALERVGISQPVRRPYTAPERAAGMGWDRRADIFGLAALMYELIWGRRLTATGAHAAEALSDISDVQVRNVFARALAEKPADRFETALTFVEALNDAIAVAPAPIGGRQAVASLQTTDDNQSAVDGQLAVGGASLPAPDRHASADGQQASADNRRPSVAGEKSTVAAGELPLFAAAASDSAGAQSPSRQAAATPSEAPGISEPASDLELRAAEESRYVDVEAAPSIVEPSTESHLSLASASHAEPSSGPDIATADLKSPVPPIVSSEKKAREAVAAGRRSISPLALALILLAVGVAVGFLWGYGVADRPSDPSQSVTDTVRPGSPATSGTAAREFTERAVNTAPETEVRLKPDATGNTSNASGASTSSSAPRPDGASSPRVSPVPPARGAAPGRGATDGRAAASPPPNRSETPARGATPAAAANIGSLLVRSTPAGATVLVNGRDAGRTPVALRQLARGTHTVRITRDGYAPQERRVTITAERPAQSLEISLARARTAPPAASPAARPVQPASASRFSAALVVDSLPGRASVFLDGKPVGRTPLTLENVDAGNHAIRIELDGYRRWTSSIRVVAGQTNRVTASLER